MTSKNIGIISYITIIGWIVAYYSYTQSEKSPSARFHLRQSLGLMLAMVIVNVITYTFPFLGTIVFFVLGLALLALWIIGIMNAVNEKENPLPLVGDFFDKSLTFVS